MAGLRRRHHRLHEVTGDVLEQRVKVDLLLIIAAECSTRLLTDDRHHRLVIELGVVEPVEKVDRARPGRRHADADLAGPFGMGAGHEGGGFLMPRLNEVDAVVASERRDEPANAIARKTKYAFDAGGVETLKNEIGDCGHRKLPS